MASIETVFGFFIACFFFTRRNASWLLFRLPVYRKLEDLFYAVAGLKPIFSYKVDILLGIICLVTADLKIIDFGLKGDDS